VSDKDRQIEMKMSFYATWKDPRIYQKKKSEERVNIFDTKEKIFLPDFYVYSLVELQKTKMFYGISEMIHLYPDGKLQ